MGPRGPIGMPRPQVRQGTSHVVPVVVSAGLAVGVFCGLLFGVGTKHEAPPSKASNGAKQSEESQIQTAAVSVGTRPSATGSAATAGSAAVPATGSAAPATGSAGAGSAVAAATPPKPGKLTLDIKPDGAAQAAKIFIDGRQLTTGTTADIAFDPGTKDKTVKVVVQASGYQEETRDQPVRSEETTSLSIQLRPVRAANTGGGGASDGGATTGGGNKGGGSKGTGKGSGAKGTSKGSGLIDI